MPQIQILSKTVGRRALLADGGTLLAAWLGCNSILAPPARAEEPVAVDLPTHRTAAPRALPDLSFLDEAGATRHLADWHGRIVVLNLWATWCQPCVAEMPALAALARQVAPGGDIAVLPVSIDHGGAELVRRFYLTHSIADLPVLSDPHMQIPTALREEGVPVTLVIDRAGREVLRIVGPVRWDPASAPERLRGLAAGG
ncbi:TlpA family protein disulfide reductase [Gluconacetobacter takamatsuzukensis]|uniref:TlpA family protein disulfide reductase n=1 Tax=Gluconacetobacter takamatsuzukensis TaxID=1286190 RepID=A0A7W4PSD8_9PROT|nr:TlpA disulfide reductase family protein [Gluconacetobacter takamatsuzukensis]MBB2206319.1 TlpA family protein disulfide reductase [Gluconacetobacter takamatsuzukensis]